MGTKRHKISNFNNIDLYMDEEHNIMNEPYCIIRFEDEESVISIGNPNNRTKNIFILADEISSEFIKIHNKQLLNCWYNKDFSWIEDD